MKINIKKCVLIGLIGIIGLVGVGVMYAWNVSSVEFSEETKRYIAESKQYRDGRFVGPDTNMGFDSFKSMFVERFFGDNKDERKASRVLPRREVSREYLDKSVGGLNATWLGHSSLLINIDGCKVLTDPVFDDKVSIVGPERYNGSNPLDPSLLPRLDIVIISHDHYDHLNKNAITLLAPKTNKFVVPLGVAARLEKWGIEKEQIVELDWWDEYEYGDDIVIVATPASHFSGRFLTDRNKTLWASWVINGKESKAFFSGDSGYFDGFKEIGKRYGPFDITFLECGAYNERWRDIHMSPEETVKANIDLKGDILHPIHWGTYNLAFHSWDEPMKRLTAEAARLGVTVSTPIVGETTVIGERVHNVAWWLPEYDVGVSVETLVNSQTLTED